MNVREVRNKLKLTVSELSQKTQIESVTIRAYEMGTAIVRDEDRKKIEKLVKLMEVL